VRAAGGEVVRLQPVDGHIEAALVALHRRHVVLNGGGFGEDGVQSGLEIVTHGRREDQRL
jgi:hypothetical protein